ncbi:MAG TPA: bifunctional 5,10-methylenetetrahydrofolate dehydrogenase/5,10-methenyltetrahydrofolate cyclohydrolase [bacterium]|nr:bifunctional 5,10-methylenetetrahydrofolate dehydrogenase/5,10-methenyltetrahydrofolate cyclohydrolase [bacterium]HQQ38292.1 bifunctional 5,10-methylenetetrahydrofolate dehydrogenase/5,10-methenyltetrahydrofolate cyclohydrolase [bacterium]
MKKTAEIIDGKIIAKTIKDDIALEIFNHHPHRPNLAIILVGERPDSELYVSLKEREAKKVGIDTHLYRFDNNVKESELLETISFLNNDTMINAILVQLPLPETMDANKIISSINPLKDADGFHLLHPDYVVSPVIAAVDFVVKKYQAKGRACVFYRSEVFGQGLNKHLQALGLEVDLLAVNDDEDPRQNKELKKRLSAVSVKSDVVVTALGLSHFLNQDYCREGAILIDVGISKENGVVLGDVDFKSVAQKASAITPVPGGVGPMTIAFLFRNVWEIYKHNN